MAEKLDTSKSLNAAKERAQMALFDAVAQGIADLADSSHNVTAQSQRVRDLAFAYRLASGGAQPGSVEISK